MLRLTRAALLLALTGTHAQGLAAAEAGQSFKDWAVACDEVEGDAGSRCYIFQNIALKDTGQRLLHVAVGRVGDTSQTAAIVTLPLGIFLPSGVALDFEEGEPTRFPVQQCTTAGCRGVLALSEELLLRLKLGRELQVKFRDGTGREIAVPVSLMGFTAGLDAISR